MAKINPPILPIHPGARWSDKWAEYGESYYENRGVVTADKFNQLVDALDQTIKMLNSSKTGVPLPRGAAPACRKN